MTWEASRMVQVRRRRDPERTREVLASWFGRRLGADVTVEDYEVPANGFSNETICVRLAYEIPSGRRRERFVVRVGPTDHQLFLHADVFRQWDVMAALAATSDVPVPPLQWRETDASVLGAPFYVMGHVEGRIPPDLPSYHEAGWVTMLRPGERSRMIDNALVALAHVHRTPWQPFAFLAADDRTADSLGALVTDVEASFAWAARGRSYPIQERALRHLRDARPDSPPISLLWGDCRIGNVVFGDDLGVRSVLDWEMAALGPAEADLAWWLMMERRWTEGRGVPRLPGVPDRDEIISRYQTLLGRPLGDLHYYEVLAALRLSVVMIRTNDNLAEYGVLPADHTVGQANPITQHLASLVGLPVPELSPQFSASIAALHGGHDVAS